MVVAGQTEDVVSPDGVVVRYHVDGNGPDVLLIHGGLVSSSTWDGQVDRLRRAHRVVRFDLRGLGKSGAPADASAYTIGKLPPTPRW